MSDNYPTEEELRRIREWPLDDPRGWLDYVRRIWDQRYGSIRLEEYLILATGGWSSNEEIISAMHDNRVLWASVWQSSHRGGMFKFTSPEALS